MDLLFNKDNKGEKEFKELLGFIDASLKYKNMISDAKFATKEVIKLIGNATYAKAVTAYQKDTQTTSEKELIFSVRYPIAINTYRKYAPSNDLSHTSNGRVSRTEEHEKMAFEWMIEKSNKNMERKYYQALDELIDYLDENVTTWKETEAYKSTHKLFLRKTEDFDNYFPIGNSRLLLIKLVPGIRRSEQSQILPRIGKELFDNLKNKLKGEDLPDFEINQNLLEKIKEACAFYAMSWSMNRLSVQLFPEGVLQSVISDRMTMNAKVPAIKSESEAARQAFLADANAVFIEIEQIIKDLQPKPEPQEIPTVLPKFNADDKFLTS